MDTVYLEFTGGFDSEGQPEPLVEIGIPVQISRQVGLMLTSQARETLRGVDTVIIDEVHAVAGTKRGAHLGITMLSSRPSRYTRPSTVISASPLPPCWC